MRSSTLHVPQTGSRARSQSGDIADEIDRPLIVVVADFVKFQSNDNE